MVCGAPRVVEGDGQSRAPVFTTPTSAKPAENPCDLRNRRKGSEPTALTTDSDGPPYRSHGHYRAILVKVTQADPATVPGQNHMAPDNRSHKYPASHPSSANFSSIQPFEYMA